MRVLRLADLLHSVRLTASINTACVTRIYLGIDTYFWNTGKALETLFYGDLPKYSTYPLSSSFSVVGCSESGGLVLLFSVLGFASFVLSTGLLHVLDESSFVSVLLWTVVCTPVTNTRLRKVV